MKTIRDTKTNEVFTVSDKEAARVLPTGRYIEVEVEKKASGVAPGAVSTVAGEPAAPSGADTPPTFSKLHNPIEAPVADEPAEDTKKSRKK